MKLLLLPGMDGTGKLFEALINALPSNIEPIVISYPVNDYLGYEKLEEYVIRQLPKTDNYFLLAESFSGPIGYLLAKKKFENMLGVVFVATFLRCPSKLLVKLSNILPVTLFLKLPIPNLAIKWLFLGKQADLKAITLLKEILNSSNKKIISYRIKEISKLSLNLEAISINSYYIQALNDKLISPGELSQFEKVSSKLKVFKINGPHFILQAKPKECAEIISKEINLITSHFT